MLPIACHLFCYRQILGREALIEKLDTALGQVAAAGFAGVQHFLDAVSEPKTARQFAKLLAKHGLRPAGIYASGPLFDPRKGPAFERSLLESMEMAREHLDLRSVTLNIDSLPNGASKTDAQLVAQGEALRRLGHALTEAGVRLLYHFHTPEMADDAREFKTMMRLAPHRFMGVCFDVDAVHRGGQIPGDLLDQFAPRVQETHLRSSRDGLWEESLGDGDVCFQDLIELLDDYDFKGWHVVDLCRENGTPKTITVPEALKRSFAYAQNLIVVSHNAVRWRYRHI